MVIVDWDDTGPTYISEFTAGTSEILFYASNNGIDTERRIPKVPPLAVLRFLFNAFRTFLKAPAPSVEATGYKKPLSGLKKVVGVVGYSDK